MEIRDLGDWHDAHCWTFEIDPAQVRLHWVTMALASIFGSLGVTVIYYNKNLNHKPHFTSWHGLVGVITMALFVTQALGGIIVLYPASILGLVSRSNVKKFHVVSGCMAALLSYLSFFLAMYSNWFTSKFSGIFWYVCLIPFLFWSFSILYFNLKRLR